MLVDVKGEETDEPLESKKGRIKTEAHKVFIEVWHELAHQLLENVLVDEHSYHV